ncbi:MAG: DUF697 domain-containing protein [Nodosilinea sp.]
MLTQSDEMEPSRFKHPSEYPSLKIENINKSVAQIKRILDEKQLVAQAILPISSYIEWDQNPQIIPEEDWQSLSIIFDGRYRIDDLLDILEKNIDIKAGIFLMLASRVNEVAKKMSNKIVNIFSTISFAVGTTPIPFQDLYILFSFQCLMIMLIAYLAGCDLSFESARKVMISIGGNGLAGLGFRALAQQSVKAMNLWVPVSGSFVSGSIAATGTRAIGKASIKYYFDGVSLEVLREIFESAKAEDSSPE